MLGADFGGAPPRRCGQSQVPFAPMTSRRGGAGLSCTLYPGLLAARAISMQCPGSLVVIAFS